MKLARRSRPIPGWFLVVVVPALVLTACAGDDHKTRSFVESDRPKIVRGEVDAPDGLTLGGGPSGPLSLTQLAEDLELARRLGEPTGELTVEQVDSLGYVVGRQEHFHAQGSDGSAAYEAALVFRDVKGAEGLFDLLEGVAETRIKAGLSERIDASGLGADALGLEHEQGENGRGYAWRIDNVVLSVSGVGSVDQKAFAERLNDRATRAR